MRKKTLKVLTCVLLQMFAFQSAHAQLSMDRQGTEVIIPTSQTYDFIKYGSVGASLYTGTVNYSLPVYTYKDKDFEIPISFDYASNGYKPNSRGGELGLGWTLNSGGSITREIKGIPDDITETVISPIGPGVSIQGFLALSKSSYNESSLNTQIALNSTGEIVYYNQDQTQQNCYDISPDIFHFNFMGHSGYFHVWYNNKVMVYSSNPNDHINVEINGSMKSMILTTQDGYKYYFGGSELGNEYILMRNNDGLETSCTYTWKLCSIKAPNGRTVDFKYQKTQGYYGTTYNYQPYSTFFYNMSTAGVSSQNKMKNIQSTGMRSCPLTKIEIMDGPMIDFSYIASSGEVYSNYNSMGGTTDAVATPKLNKVTVINKADTIARCNLTYKLSSPNISYNSRTTNIVYFLSTVNIKGEGAYNFEYYNMTDKGFPALGSFSIDHWGYYNARNDNRDPINFIDFLSYTNVHTESIGTDIRNSDSTHTQMGMLKQINYPFGGYSKILYEQHCYSKKVNRDSGFSFLPKLINIGSNEKDAGGLRIKKVETYNTNGNIIDSKTYLYVGVDGLSSGILLSVPRYGISYNATSNSAQQKVLKYCSLYDLYSYDNVDIEYSRVVQINWDESKNIYSYTNYGDYPDLSLFNEYSDRSIPSYIQLTDGRYSYDYYNIVSGNTNIKNILSPLASMQGKRGKLKSMETLSPLGIIQKTENQYITTNEHSYSYPLSVGESYRYIGRNYFSFWPKSSNTQEYFESKEVTIDTDNTYNSYGQLSSTTINDSKGNQEITRYEYATDYASSGEIYATMVSCNLLDYPITIKTYYKPITGNEIQISGKKYTYALFNNIVKPSTVFTYNSTNDSWQLETTFNSYDTKGNLTQSTDANEISTAYIWGYNGLYLVAKGQNVTYSILSAQVGTSSDIVGGLTASHTLVSGNCPNALIDFYEYKPLVGISKHTDPSGKILTYSYNSSGKLKAITDENGKLHNEYLYSPDNKK